jgi:O-acetyl-ADP-ribose deacetylase (regulator of RNase III)
MQAAPPHDIIGPMDIILAALDAPLADAWQRHCAGLDGVRLQRGSILDLNVDAVVSPANSFGFMDGGIDRLYTQRFGWRVQERLQSLIRGRHHGELLVGAAEIVDTDNEQIPYVIAAPTMRVPMILRDSVNPYLAARAALLLVKHGVFPAGPLEGEPIAAGVQSLAFPGLGTCIGQVDPETCARQVRAALEEVLGGRHTFPTSWADAQARHQRLYSDDVRDLQRG